jgi:predicted alpha/beta superfamily hydrolase
MTLYLVARLRGVDVKAKPLALAAPKVDERLTQAHVERIAQKYRVDYWVLPEHKQTSYPVVYSVDGWKVVRIVPKGNRAL